MSRRRRLRGVQYLPYGRAAHAMDVLCALTVAPATILAAVREAADRLGPFVDRVRMLLRAEAVIGADETPAWVDGGWKYVHVACTEKLGGVSWIGPPPVRATRLRLLTDHASRREIDISRYPRKRGASIIND